MANFVLVISDFKDHIAKYKELRWEGQNEIMRWTLMPSVKISYY